MPIKNYLGEASLLRNIWQLVGIHTDTQTHTHARTHTHTLTRTHTHTHTNTHTHTHTKSTVYVKHNDHMSWAVSVHQALTDGSIADCTGDWCGSGNEQV